MQKAVKKTPPESEDVATKSKSNSAKEGNSASSSGQLNRPGAKKVGIRETRAKLNWISSLREASNVNEADREADVTIIREGLGNKRDKHFYTKESLKASALKFNGAKCYADHPTRLEETNRPERSIRDIVGYYKDCRYEESEGVGRIVGTLKINQGDNFTWAWDMLKEAINFSQTFSDRDYVGISINAGGVTHPENDENNEVIHFVDSINQIVSADIVTEAGAGGGINGLKEAVALLESAGKRGNKMYEKKAFQAAVEALGKVRGGMSEVKEHDEMYGGALDEIIAQLQKLDQAAGSSDPGEGEETKEDEAAGNPPSDKSNPKEKPASSAGKPGTQDPKDGEGDSEAEAEKAYREGSMSQREKKIYEAMLGERSKRSMVESKALVEKKLKESGIAPKFMGDLRMILIGKTEKEIDSLIEARKDFLKGLMEDRATGAGSKSASGEGSKLRESLAGAGIPLKEKK